MISLIRTAESRSTVEDFEDDSIEDESEPEEDDFNFKDPGTYLRKAVYASWRRANGKATLSDITNGARRYGALKPFPK